MPADIPKYALRPHSFERLAHPVQHIAAPAGRPPFCMLCVLCRDSLRGQSLMNLDWCFVVVWPQRQTFVRILLQQPESESARADVRRAGAAVSLHTYYTYSYISPRSPLRPRPPPSAPSPPPPEHKKPRSVCLGANYRGTVQLQYRAPQRYLTTSKNTVYFTSCSTSKSTSLHLTL